MLFSPSAQLMGKGGGGKMPGGSGSLYPPALRGNPGDPFVNRADRTDPKFAPDLAESLPFEIDFIGKFWK
jgi:hypothetical protein